METRQTITENLKRHLAASKHVFDVQTLKEYIRFCDAIEICIDAYLTSMSMVLSLE